MRTYNLPRYEIIATGSQGNAVVLEQSILIDCGVPWKALEQHWRGLQLVLLTHWHGDHFNRATVRRLAAERPALRWGCCGWMVARLVDLGVRPSQIDMYIPGGTVVYPNSMRVTTFSLRHDVPNCGYVLQFDGGRSAMYATDTSSLEGVIAPGLGLYLLEANHVTEEIRRRIADKEAAGVYAYEKRAAEMHLSKEQCDNWFYENGGANSELIYMHCHVEKEEHPC